MLFQPVSEPNPNQFVWTKCPIKKVSRPKLSQHKSRPRNTTINDDRRVKTRAILSTTLTAPMKSWHLEAICFLQTSNLKFCTRPSSRYEMRHSQEEEKKSIIFMNASAAISTWFLSGMITTPCRWTILSTRQRHRWRDLSITLIIPMRIINRRVKMASPFTTYYKHTGLSGALLCERLRWFRDKTKVPEKVRALIIWSRQASIIITWHSYTLEYGKAATWMIIFFKPHSLRARRSNWMVRIFVIKCLVLLRWGGTWQSSACQKV